MVNLCFWFSRFLIIRQIRLIRPILLSGHSFLKIDRPGLERPSD